MKIPEINGRYFSRKPAELPEYLIFHSKRNNKEYKNYDFYNIFDIKNNGSHVGELVTQIEDIPLALAGFYPEGDLKPSLKIVKLVLFKRSQGLGSKLIQFALKRSREQGLNGRVHVLSSDMYDSERPPHIFYRKNKFSSRSKNLLKIIDNCIITGEEKPFKFHDIRMFYAPECRIGEFADFSDKISEETPSIFTKLICILKKAGHYIVSSNK